MSRLGKLLRGFWPGGTHDQDRGRDATSGAALADHEPASKASASDEESIPEVVEVPIEDVLDLHSFPPSETRHVVEAYIEEAVFHGLREVRIIHGRGTGVQREMVRSLLVDHPLVESFGDAEATRGGWGATVAFLRALGEVKAPDEPAAGQASAADPAADQSAANDAAGAGSRAD